MNQVLGAFLWGVAAGAASATLGWFCAFRARLNARRGASCSAPPEALSAPLPTVAPVATDTAKTTVYSVAHLLQRTKREG